MTALALAYLAGLLTTLNPCVLPVLPLVLAGTLATSRLGPLAFAAGLVLAFTALGLLVATIGIGLGITPQLLRQIAAVLLILAGIVMLVPALRQRFAAATSGIATGADALAGRLPQAGLLTPLLLGGIAGALWAPCSGPSLGAAVALAAEADGLGPAALRMLAFGIGAASVLVLLAYGSRAVIKGRRDFFMRLSSRLGPVAAVVLVAAGFAFLLGWDKALETALVLRMPEWLLNLTTSV